MDEHVLSLVVNGRPTTMSVTAGETLLDALRERLGLTAAKPGCAAGQCGACTVLVDGAPATACLTLAAQVADAAVTTAEGVPPGHPLATQMIRQGAVQCGYCTPGMLMAALGAFEGRNDQVTEQDVRRALAGNLCRCTGYRPIVDAVLEWRTDSAPGGGHQPTP